VVVVVVIVVVVVVVVVVDVVVVVVVVVCHPISPRRRHARVVDSGEGREFTPPSPLPPTPPPAPSSSCDPRGALVVLSGSIRARICV